MISSILLFLATVSASAEPMRLAQQSNLDFPLEQAADTTSFAYSTDITLNTVYNGMFYYPGDSDYYHYSLDTSGYYIGLAANNKNIRIEYYGSSDHGQTTTLIRGVTTNSSNPNFGYEYGNYFDTSDFTDIYIFVADRNYSSSPTSYSFTFCEFEKRTTNDLQLIKYDVETGFYSYIVHGSQTYGAPVTSGFNPNGDSSIQLPNYSPLHYEDLTTLNGYNTTVTYPYTAIGRCYIPASPITNYVSSGFMISSNFYATDAHCVYNNGRIIPSLNQSYVRFGQNASNSYLTEGSFKTIYIPILFHEATQANDWATRAENDWAICEMDNNYGLTTGYLPVMCSNQLNFTQNDVINVIGYAASDHQIIAYGSYISKTTYHIFHTAVGAGGRSGSPTIDHGNGYVIGLARANGQSDSNSTLFYPSFFWCMCALTGGYIS